MVKACQPAWKVGGQCGWSAWVISAGDHCSTLGTRIGPLNSWNLDFKIGLMGHY